MKLIRRITAVLTALLLTTALGAPCLAVAGEIDQTLGGVQYCSNGTVIVRKALPLERGICYDYSTDGVNWTPIDYPWTSSPELVKLLPNSGMDLFALDTFKGILYVSTDGVHWTAYEQKDLSWADGGTSNYDYTLRWTGDGYVMRQRVISRSIMGASQSGNGVRNHLITFLTRDLKEISTCTMENQVWDVGFLNGTYYATVGAPEKTSVWSSTDRQSWTRTSLAAIPTGVPSGIKTLRQGDVGTQIARPTSTGANPALVFHNNFGRLSVSRDGLYFADLNRFGLTSNFSGIYTGSQGVVLDYVNSAGVGITYAEAESALSKLSAQPNYVTLNGAYLPLEHPPYAKNNRLMVPLRSIAEALSFTVDWDQAAGKAVCTKGDQVVTVTFGSTAAQVNGVATVLDAAPEVLENRTYVPLRFLGEGFGLAVDWDQAARTARLTIGG